MAEEKVIYEEVDKPSEWTLRNYFRSIKVFKWWVIGATVLGALLGFVSLKFIINPSRKVLTATYTYDLAAKPGTGDTFYFIDGSMFNYFDILSKENLGNVKMSDEEKFKGIDVDKIHSNGVLAVEKVITTTKSSEETINDVSFKITARANAFPNETVGKEFVFAVVNSPKQISTQAINNFKVNSYIGEEFGGSSFEKQIAALKNQYSAIDNTYLELRYTFGSSVSVDESDKKISESYNQFVTKYSDGSINSVDLLEGKMLSNFFVKYEVGKETEKINELHSLCKSYAESIASYEKEYAVLNQSMSDLKSSTTVAVSDTTYTSKLLSLTDSISKCKSSIDKLEKQLNSYGYYKDGSGKYVYESSKESVISHLTAKEESWVQSNKGFATEVTKMAESLEDSRKEVTDVYKNLYSKYQNKVTLTGSGYVNLSGSISNLIGIAGGAVLFFLVSSFVVTAIYVYKDKKEE